MVALLVPYSLVRSLLFCYYLAPSRFRNEVLQTALQAFHKGNELVQSGDYKAATSHFQWGILIGRPVVLKLQEQLETKENQPPTSPPGSPWVESSDRFPDDNPYLALEWLAQSYVASSQAHILLGDFDAARRDAWGACLLSHNRNPHALECLLQVSVATGDAIGELSSLKMILTSVCLLQQEYLERKSSSMVEEVVDKELYETELKLQQLKSRIEQLQQELDEKYKKRKGSVP